MESGDRLAEALGAVSLAADRARGQAPESILGAAILATRLAGQLGLYEDERAVTYYTAVTRGMGCTSTSMDAAPMAFGNDLALVYSLNMADFTDPEDIRSNIAQHWAPTADPEVREQGIAQIMEVLPQMGPVPLIHAYQAASLTRRLPVVAGVSEMLGFSDARWDGMNPTRPAGEDIPLVVRIIEFATMAELYRRAGGSQAVLDLIEGRAGRQFDPHVCATFVNDAADLLAGFEATSLWDLYLETEPEPHLLLGAEHRRPVAEVVADFADNKSGWTVGHSRLVAGLAAGAAEHLGLPEHDRTRLEMAGLVHDLGRCAVPNGVWDKPEQLSPGEMRLAQSHSRHTEEILTSSTALQATAALAGAAHERLDGSGYHHGTKRQELRTQVLAAADVFAALIQDRAWRDAFSEGEAAELLTQEADAGRLSTQAVSAVLVGRGHESAPHARVDLTPRETEVLAHLAQGLQTKQIAAKLGIAYKTADNHIQNIYGKIGANTRTAAALYALEHGIYSA